MTAILRLQLDDKDPVRVNSAINQLAEYSDRNQRTRLTANTTFYVSTSGSDSNNGLSSGAPFLTLQHAYDTIAGNFDFGGQNITVQIGNGTYTNPLVAGQSWTGGGTLSFIGDTVTPSNVVISTTSHNAISISAGLSGSLIFGGIRFKTTTSGDCINHTGTGPVKINAVDFNTCTGSHISIFSSGATITVTGNYTISGGAQTHYFIINSGNLFNTGNTATVTGTPPNFTVAFAQCRIGGTLQVNTSTFSGSATGVRYAVDTGGGIFTNGGGINFLPGSSPGVVTPPGWYT